MVKPHHLQIPAARVALTTHQLLRLDQKPVALRTLLACIRDRIRLGNHLAVRAKTSNQQPTALVRVITDAVCANLFQLLFSDLDHAAKACSISAMISSIFSIPSEMRTRPSMMPHSFFRAGKMSRCEAVVGCSTLVNTSPRLVERIINFNASIKRKAASLVLSRSSIVTSAPRPG